MRTESLFDKSKSDILKKYPDLRVLETFFTKNGEVIKAATTDSNVAIKFSIGGAKATDAERLRVKSINREASNLKRLRDDVGLDLFVSIDTLGDTTFLTTRWVEGASLGELARTLREANNKVEIISNCTAAASYLKHLNDADWLHADLQPAHFVKSAYTNKFSMIDFGWAQKIHDQSEYKGAMVHFASVNVAKQMAVPGSTVKISMSDEVFSMIAVSFFCLFGTPIWHYNDTGKRPTLIEAINAITDGAHIDHHLQQTTNDALIQFLDNLIELSRTNADIGWNYFDEFSTIAMKSIS